MLVMEEVQEAQEASWRAQIAYLQLFHIQTDLVLHKI